MRAAPFILIALIVAGAIVYAIRTAGSPDDDEHQGDPFLRTLVRALAATILVAAMIGVGVFLKTVLDLD
jgi:hypothetical protein